MLLHLRLILCLALIFIIFAAGITFAVVITFSGDTAVALLQNGINEWNYKPEACKTGRV